MTDFKYGDITEKIIGASFRVHSAGSKRLEFHRFTNKEYNPNIIQHPVKSQSSQ